MKIQGKIFLIPTYSIRKLGPFFFRIRLHTRPGYFYTHVMTKNDDDSEILRGKNLPLKNVLSLFDLING